MPLVKSQKNITFKPKEEVLKFEGDFTLECGQTLKNIEIAYTTHGSLNSLKSNVVWVFHALTGNAKPTDWWPEVIGDGKVIDPKKYFIVCANVLGGCYGSTGPLASDQKFGLPKLHNFPVITIKDIVRGHILLRQKLGLEQIFLGIGGSLGGQQLLEWAVMEPSRFQNIIPIATNARHSAWGIAFNETQRMAIEADPSFYGGSINGGKKGLEAARAIAMLSYRTQDIYRKKQTDHHALLDNFKASGYQKYQGQKLSKRFSAHSYYILSKAMDSHHLGRERKSLKKVLKTIKSRTLVIGFKSDILFPLAEQKYIASNISNGKFFPLDSIYGHDGFLAESESLTKVIKKFIEE